MAIALPKRRFTVFEYHKMVEAGILSEDDRVELIEGEVVAMRPIGSRHAACVARLTALFSRIRRRGIVWVQNPIRLGEHSEPQPDLALLRYRPDFYAGGHPGPGDVLLVVEVAETSADSDRQVKVPLYGRYGIPEVWLVDLAGDRVEVFRQPTPAGYQNVRVVRRGETLGPTLLAGAAWPVEEILGLLG
jgi:Uma2 family endonuclease